MLHLYSIDATHSKGLGRLCNDEHRKPNAIMKKIYVGSNVHLCLFALEEIHANDEVRYDYGPDGGSMHWREVYFL